ncbi:hypothetical protein HBN50_07695 [Halobacteriovorax sp. GB3]|uniref:hypothetical protein n=1 Tax=Halobacteriovorax sp. GB3 TaxID=2719615 RepID=UPI00235E90E6|nr:hypothetical protein [Halobacteriovorax sp. GB3]MDD0852974.1 hypothetical protein [Halobacteriovorax sp. GB3]
MTLLLMCLHVILMNIDEHYFNKGRAHSVKEIWSIIIDAALFFVVILFATFVPFSQEMIVVYKALAALSMISIIKNEFFYQGLKKEERLVHASLYVLHPIILFNFYESWQNNYFHTNTNFWMFQVLYVGLGFKTLCYQIIYWNYINENIRES